VEGLTINSDFFDTDEISIDFRSGRTLHFWKDGTIEIFNKKRERIEYGNLDPEQRKLLISHFAPKADVE